MIVDLTLRIYELKGALYQAMDIIEEYNKRDERLDELQEVINKRDS